MTLDHFRPHVREFFKPLTDVAIRLGITPNALSIASFCVAGIAGIAFYLGRVDIGVIMVAANAFFDALDGAVARAMNVQSPKGDFLDHAIDRYSDIFIITGIFAGGIVPWQVGVFALTGVLMASYLGTQAQAVGVGRYYGGLLGRADRLVMIMAAGILTIAFPQGFLSVSFLEWLLLIFGITGHLTAVQRFVYVWKRMP